MTYCDQPQGESHEVAGWRVRLTCYPSFGGAWSLTAWLASSQRFEGFRLLALGSEEECRERLAEFSASPPSPALGAEEL